MRILLPLLPILPAIAYIIYYFYRNRKKTRKEILTGLNKGNWFAVFIVTVVFTITVVIIITLGNTGYKGDKYVPAKYENGVLQPSRIEQ